MAKPALADILRRLREERYQESPDGYRTSSERISGHAQSGLHLLLEISQEPEFGDDLLERCRHLAEQDRRFRFVYSLPVSVGFGVAIGVTLESTVFSAEKGASKVTGLLSAFMTILDGLLDEAPEVISEQREALFFFVERQSRDQQSSEVDLSAIRHPFVSLCFALVRLWSRLLREAMSPDAPRAAWEQFRSATVQAMRAEYEMTASRYQNGLPESDAALYGRTRWSHWCQALACAVASGWPSCIDAREMQRLIFSIADYAAYLDDLVDYIQDCERTQWNTVSHALYLSSTCNLSSVAALQRHLLLFLADEVPINKTLKTGLAMKRQIANNLNNFYLNSSRLNMLVDDLTYAHLG